MTGSMDCARAESLAGAIALGEARDDERHAYRAHLAHCGRCLNALGGEREIERAMALVASARESERWEPDIRRRLARAIDGSSRWRWLPVTATGVAAVLAIAIFEARPVVPHKSALPAPVSAEQTAAVAALGTDNVPAFQHQAESLQFRSGATLTLRVAFDAHGKPVRCAVLRGAQPSLDRAVCAAVMRSRL